MANGIPNTHFNFRNHPVMDNEIQVNPLPKARPFIDLFLGAYMDAALFAATDETRDGIPLDRNYTTKDFAPETITRMESDCLLFYTLGNLEDMTNEQLKKAGHHFLLTRNRHGAGFWDGDWPEPQATTLTELAHTFLESDLYLGENDNLIYLSNFGRYHENDANQIAVPTLE